MSGAAALWLRRVRSGQCKRKLLLLFFSGRGPARLHCEGRYCILAGVTHGLALRVGLEVKRATETIAFPAGFTWDQFRLKKVARKIELPVHQVDRRPGAFRFRLLTSGQLISDFRVEMCAVSVPYVSLPCELSRAFSIPRQKRFRAGLAVVSH